MSNQSDLAKSAAGFNGDPLSIDTANNRVGIGTSLPSSFFSGASQLVVGSGSGAQGITIYSANNDNAQIFFADGTTGDEAYRGILRYRHDDDAMTFHTAGATERMRIDSAGRVTMPNQPMFIGNHTDSYATTITTGSKLTYFTASLNRGGHWSNTNQKFTAPVGGVYYVFASDVCPTTNRTGSIVITKNGSTVIRGYTEEREKRVYAYVDCSASDYIEFYTSDGTLQLYGGAYGQYAISLVG